MDSIITSFNKNQMNQCTAKCLNKSNFSFLTHNERSCFNGCTKTVSALTNIPKDMNNDFGTENRTRNSSSSSYDV